MINRNILQHYKGYELLVKQLDEAINRYNRNYLSIEFDFFNIDSLDVIKSFLADSVPYKLIGGYQEAMAHRLVIGDQINEEDYVTCLRARFNPKFNKLTHRDIQGALYNTGFDISKFGDYWIEDDYIYLYLVSELKDDIIASFTQISHCKIKFEQCEYAKQVFQFEELNVVASSLRLDKVVASIIRKSREKAKDMICGQLIKVNYKMVEDCSFMCNNDDILSIRMYGRFRIKDIVLNQKSGNYRISIYKYR